MKVHGGIKADDFTQLVLPNGSAFPRNPKQGEVFWLTSDEVKTNTMTEWHSRGIYYFNYGSWFKLNHDSRQTKSSIIGSQIVDIEEPIKPLVAPSKADFLLSAVAINPSNSKSGVSCTASLWLEARAECCAILTIWRHDIMVGMTVQSLEPKKPVTVSISAYDLPLTGFAGVVTTATRVGYELRLGCSKETALCVNRGNDQFVYDLVSAQTAFTIRETD